MASNSHRPVEGGSEIPTATLTDEASSTVDRRTSDNSNYIKYLCVNVRAASTEHRACAIIHAYTLLYVLALTLQCPPTTPG